MRKTVSTFFLAFFVLVVVLSSSSCKKDENNPVATTNPFAGTWSFLVAGSYVGTGQMIVGSDGGFSFNILLTNNGQTFTNTISGNIATNGQVQNGKIFYSGSQVGTATGTFTGNAGSGAYQTNTSAGTWSATKWIIILWRSINKNL